MEDQRRTYGNETMYEVTPIEMHLSKEWDKVERLEGKLHSKFEKVQNYLFEVNGKRRLLTVMTEGNGLMPDSIILTKKAFLDLKKQKEQLVIKQKDGFFINHIYINQKSISSCNLPECLTKKLEIECLKQRQEQLNTYLRKSEKKSDLERLPERYAQHIEELADVLIHRLDCEEDKWEKIFLQTVGAGRGLTPAADDAMIGAFAGCLMFLICKKQETMYFTRMKRISPLLEHTKLTTDISGKYLECACNGDFSKNIILVIQSLTGDEDVDFQNVLSQIGNIGHSSGMDMLFGLNISIDCIIRKWGER